MSYHYSAADRLIKYVQIDTESDAHSTTFPSTEKQKNLSKLLVQELLALGITDATMDEHGYVMATIKSNSSKQNIPVICFCSHVDTSPDCSGANVKPIIHKNWNGEPIVLPDDATQIITIEEHPYLKEKIGEDIITASGTTLLGADDKAGVAIIMDLAQYLMANPAIIHGDIRILFTPDEEVGRGVEKLDMKKLGADFGYTLDGGERGSLEGETFSADGVHITIHGVSAHPGAAKGILVNALKVAGAFIDALPKDSWSPETTEDRQGFVHPLFINGNTEKVDINFIIRNHDTKLLAEYEARLENILKNSVAQFPKARYEFKVQEQYRNMAEILVNHPQVMQYAAEAMQRAGVVVREQIIRGGTDGSRLSFMGLPCPNIFTGEMALHGKHEYVSIQDMQKSVDTLVELVQIWEQKS
jgi:tripeptide aminopeptidase